MPTIVVEVMPKAEILDPQGKAVAGALTRLGHNQFSTLTKAEMKGFHTGRTEMKNVPMETVTLDKALRTSK